MNNIGELPIDVEIYEKANRRNRQGGENGDIDGGVHPLLCGGRPPYPNNLSIRKMETLVALCDTILPSIEYDGKKIREFPAGSVEEEEATRRFYATCASMVGAHEHIAGFISFRLKHVLVWLLQLGLWLLGTGLGTFCMCGSMSLSPSFPYLRRFSQIELHKREKILVSWSTSWCILYVYMFKVIKYLTLLTFFSKADEKNENPSWKAIGYCGADPDSYAKRTAPPSTSSTILQPNNESDDPLHGSVIDMHKLDATQLAGTLKNSGFTVYLDKANPYKSKHRPSLTVKCDVIIVGSGSGGGVAASTIARAGYKVIVLEKGGYYSRQRLSLLEGPSMDQMYESSGMLATDDLGMLVLAGATVGGGTAVNWSASLRTPDHVRKEWSEVKGLELFSSQAYLNALDAVCDRMGVQSEVDEHEESLSNSILRRGCSELGYPVTAIPRNSSSGHRCGWCCFGCKDGKKKGTCETWLVDAVDSGNCAIISGATAVRVLTTTNKKKRKFAVGVVFERSDGGGIVQVEDDTVYVIESKVTIVAGGALCTPALLKKSGLKNRHIGRNLHLHPVQMAWGYFPRSAGVDENDSANKVCYEGAIMTAMSTVAANFLTSGYGAVIQTPALHPGMFSALMPWKSGKDFKDRMARYSRTIHIFALVRDSGSGTVDYPGSVNYKLAMEDEERMREGMEKVVRILAAAGAVEVGTHYMSGERIDVKRASYDEFERFVKGVRERRRTTGPLCSAHQMGSCRMGRSPGESAVDEKGETWEVAGLFVADASVLPGAVGVNPMVTVMAVAHCTAHWVVEVLRRKAAEGSKTGGA